MYCKYCGTKLEKTSKFCSKCGKSVNVEAPVEVGKDRALASMIIGIISLFVGGLFLPLPIIGLVLASSYKGKCTEKTAGIILNIIGLILSLITLIASVIIGIVFGLAVFNEAFDKVNFGEVITNEIYSDEMWDKYDYSRIEDIADYTTNLEGNWKSYANGNSFFVFNDKEFYYYFDMNDMENNYWEGTYDYVNGQEELKKINIEGPLSKLFDKINLNIDEDFYFVSLKPTKIFENGREKINTDEMEKIVDSVVETGEVTLFVGWETKTRKVRRALSLQEQLELNTDKSFAVEDKVIYIILSKIALVAHCLIGDFQKLLNIMFMIGI
jgi:hypothetical protein